MNVVLGRKRRTPSAGQGRWSGNPQMCLRQGNGREARQVVCCFSMKFYFFFSTLFAIGYLSCSVDGSGFINKTIKVSIGSLISRRRIWKSFEKLKLTSYETSLTC